MHCGRSLIRELIQITAQAAETDLFNVLIAVQGSETNLYNELIWVAVQGAERNLYKVLIWVAVHGAEGQQQVQFLLLPACLFSCALLL